MEIKGVRGLIREDFRRQWEESSGSGLKGRDDRWRLLGEWVERGVVGAVHGVGWMVSGVMSGLCQAVRKSCWPGLGLGCGMVC